MDANLVRTNRPGLKKLLGDQEAEIMEQVWSIEGPVLARQVYERMPEHLDLAYSTVVCTMGRLVAKGLLTVIDSSTKPYQFLPTVSRTEFVDQAVGRLLQSLTADFPLAVARFLQPQAAGASEEVARAVLDAKE